MPVETHSWACVSFWQSTRPPRRSEDFLAELKQFQQAVLDHAELEEVEEFPGLQRELDAGDLKRMAIAVRAAEAIESALR
jgi:hypothetical protein